MKSNFALTVALTLWISCVVIAQTPPPSAKPPVPPVKNAAPAAKPLTEDQQRVNEVLQLLDAKLPESVIVAKIRSYGKPVQTSVDDLVRLKKAGASDAVFSALQNPAAPPVPATVAPVAAATEAARPAPVATKEAVLPKAFGLYYKSENEWVQMPQTQCNLQINKMRAILGGKLLRQKLHANLPGLAASLRLTNTDRPQFLAYFPDRKVSTFNLLRLIPKAEASLREIAELSVLYSTEQYQDKIAIDISPAGPPNMFLLIPKETLAPGEYGVIEPPPTSNNQTVALFDVWDFGIGEKAAPSVPAEKAKKN